MTTTAAAPNSAARTKISPENYRYVCETIYREAGIVLDETKHYLVEARLAPLARSEGVDSLDSLCDRMRAPAGRRVRERVVEAMTTNETLFFRDAKPFDALREAIFPEMFERLQARRTVRVWSAACSAGQEPYSIAMVWREIAPPGWKLDILATDLSEEMLEKGRTGRYLQLEVNRGLPAKYLVKYFDRAGAEWSVKPTLREPIRWQRFNLLHDMAELGPFDLVFCRNVLIYFDQPTKSRILAGIRERMAPGSYLFLGASETTLNLDDTLVRSSVGPSVAYRKPL